jgi:hypothetical protein
LCFEARITIRERNFRDPGETVAGILILLSPGSSMMGTSHRRSTGIESLEARRLFAVVTAQSADLAGFSQGLVYTFDSPVSNADVLNALTIWGPVGVAVPRDKMVVTTTGTNQVRVTWPDIVGAGGFPGVLSGVAGDYEAIIEDGVGSSFTSRSVLPFFFLAGDANFDRSVNFPDLVVVAQNYGLSGKTFAQGNLDYHGNVEFNADLIIVAKNYGTTRAPLPAPNTLTVASATSSAVTLNFNAPIDPNTGVASTTFAGFHVYRSADGVNYSPAGNGLQYNVPATGAASYSWTDPTGLSPGTTYSYLVRPYEGTSAEWRNSNEVTATTNTAIRMIAPSNVVPTRLGTSKAPFQAPWSDDSTESVLDRLTKKRVL